MFSPPMEVLSLRIVFIFLSICFMVGTKIVCWNCRGLSSKATINRIRHLMQTLHPSLVCLVETRANADRADRFCAMFTRNWNWAALLADGFSGGVIILWNKHLGQVSPIAVSRRALHLVISSSRFTSCIISVIYNSNHFTSQQKLWVELSKISALSFPWLIIGDLNTIVCQNEHRGGSFRYYSRKASALTDFIDSNNLIDLNFSGYRYTWCNNQTGLSRRWARLDRGLVNLAWFSIFSSYSLVHLPRISSDHAPLFLSLSLLPSRHKINFKFSNFWFEYLG